jgi:hypothetical protein
MLVFDTESDGFLDDSTKLHVINLIDRETGARESYHDDPEISPRSGALSEGVTRLASAVAMGRTVSGHNVIRHDIPLIAKFFPNFSVPVDSVLDTLVVSRLIWTDLKDIDHRALRKRRRPPKFTKKMVGSHSLEAWGYRLGLWKGDFAGPWNTFTQDMQDYGVQDPEVTLALIEKIEAENYSEEAIRLEHRVAEIIFLQERHGILFDKAKAEKLEIELTAEKARLEDELRSTFDPWFEPVRYKGEIVVSDPKRSQRRKAVIGEDLVIREERSAGAPYCKVKLVSFEPGSRDMIANRLKTLYGWVPADFTEKGKPKVDETTLGGLDYPPVKLLVRYLTVDKRLGQLANGAEAWLRRVGPDGRIHGQVITNGAITGRMTHKHPNLAQVPKVKFDADGNKLLGYDGGYGVESRGLFIAPADKRLVGVDAEGLELRELAHYMARYDGGAYVEAVVNGDKKLGTDAHTLNQKALGMRTRDGAKTWLYAYIYGAGALKLGKIFYEDMTEEWRDAFNSTHPPGSARERALVRLGARGRKRIEERVPALGKLQKSVKKASNKLRSHDGRLLNVRSDHSKLNTLLQGGGAVVMKKALVIAYDDLLARGWQFGREFAFVLNVHDEFQMEADPKHAKEIGQTAAEAIAKAGEAFGLRCPLAGSADVGQTWADTH